MDTTKGQRIDLHASESQESVLREAASEADASLSDFILESAVERAERILADRNSFSVSARTYGRFLDLLDEPAATDRLADLLGRSHAVPVPRKLEKSDDTREFGSGARDLDDWLRRHAWERQRANSAVTYVIEDGGKILGYYVVAAAGVSEIRVDENFGHQRSAEIPCVLLARLAVDRSAQGQGVGAALFADAVTRAATAAESPSAAALLIHCRDDEAKEYYLRHAELEESPVDTLQLVLPLARARQALGT